MAYDPAVLHNGFPNIDLTVPEGWRSGPSEEVLIALFLADDDGSYPVNTVILFGEEVFVGREPSVRFRIYLPDILKGLQR